MKTALYSGSFDPFTLGHENILLRASRLFDTVHVAILLNAGKQPYFQAGERKAMIDAVIGAHGLTNVRVGVFDGLLVDYAAKVGAHWIVRGIRSAHELEYELALEQANRHLCRGIETVYFSAEPALRHISSSMVKEIGSLHGSIDGLVPDPIKSMIAERLNEQ